MIKQKNIRDKMRYSNLSNNMMISELWTNNSYSSNTVVEEILQLYVDGRAAHVTDTTLHQGWQSTPPPPTRSYCIHPCFQATVRKISLFTASYITIYTPLALLLLIVYMFVAGKTMSLSGSLTRKYLGSTVYVVTKREERIRTQRHMFQPL
jgi:hypothetical protein